jgi:hypothetical protein
MLAHRAELGDGAAAYRDDDRLACLGVADQLAGVLPQLA